MYSGNAGARDELIDYISSIAQGTKKLPYIGIFISYFCSSFIGLITQRLAVRVLTL